MDPGAEITSIIFLSLLFAFHYAGLNSGAGTLRMMETRKMLFFLSAHHLRRKDKALSHQPLSGLTEKVSGGREVPNRKGWSMDKK